MKNLKTNVNKPINKLQNTTVPSVFKDEIRKWYFFDFHFYCEKRKKILDFFSNNNIHKIILNNKNDNESLIFEDKEKKIINVLSVDAEIKELLLFIKARGKNFLLKKDLKINSIGRLAKNFVEILRGKNRTDFFPNLDLGSHVIITNVKFMLFNLFSGRNKKKLKNKVYNYTGYRLKVKTWEEILKKSPQELVYKIIKGMMPETKLGESQMKRLLIYSEENHKHEAQRKNFIRIDI